VLKIFGRVRLEAEKAEVYLYSIMKHITQINLLTSAKIIHKVGVDAPDRPYLRSA